jgi:hypothetical protein
MTECILNPAAGGGMSALAEVYRFKTLIKSKTGNQLLLSIVQRVQMPEMYMRDACA